MNNSTVYSDVFHVLQDHFSQFVVGSLVWSYVFALYVLWASCRKTWPSLFQRPIFSTIDWLLHTTGIVFLLVFYVMIPSRGYVARWVLVGIAGAIVLVLAVIALFWGRTMFIRYMRFEELAPAFCGRNCIRLGDHWYTIPCLTRVMAVLSDANKHYFSALNREVPASSIRMSDTIYAWNGATLHAYHPYKESVTYGNTTVRLLTLKKADPLPVMDHIRID